MLRFIRNMEYFLIFKDAYIFLMDTTLSFLRVTLFFDPNTISLSEMTKTPVGYKELYLKHILTKRD